MITERKTKRKTALSAVDGGGKFIDAVVEVGKNTTDSVDHCDFLDQIEAPMWADLSLCNLANDEINDSWFDISHQFHQCSSSQLLSTIFHLNSITIQEPPSPKLPPSVSKSRGKSYKIKAWGQRNKLTTSNNQHPVKSLTMNSSTNKKKTTSNEALKVSSSCESSLTTTTTTTNTSRPKVSKSSLCSLTSHEQEHQSSGHSSSMSTVTSNRNEHQENKILEVSYQTSDLLSSLRNNLRRSCATRPAARIVVLNGRRCSEVFKSSSSQSSVNSSSNQGVNVTRVSKPLRNKSTAPNVTNSPAQNVRNLSNIQGNNSNTLTSKLTVKEKVLVRKHTSLGKVLMPHKVNEQCKVIDKEGKRAPVLGGIKKPAKAKISAFQKSVFSEKEAHLQETSKQNVVQKNGSKKLIGVKEKINTRNRDKDTIQKVYFR